MSNELINAEQLNILVCSNAENRENAESLKTALSTWANVKTWEELLDGSAPVITTLYTIVGKFDVAIVFFTPDIFEILSKNELQSTRSSLLFELALLYMYIGRKNTIVITETKKKEDFLTFLSLEATSFIIHDFSEPIEKLTARIELFCYENKIRWGIKNQSNLKVANNVKEHYLRIDMNRTRSILNFTKAEKYLGSQQANVRGDIIGKYKFPLRYSDDKDIELFLVSRNDKVIITDQGRTLDVLEKIFELREPDVNKNLNAVLKHYSVFKDKEDPDFFIPLESWQDEQGEESIELKEAVCRLYSCIMFMDSMKIFYI